MVTCLETSRAHVIRNQNGVDITLIPVILYCPLLFWKICGEGEVKVIIIIIIIIIMILFL